MNVSDLLLVGTEVSVAFAGFAGIIATFQFRDETKIDRGRVVGLTMIVQFSLLAALYSVIPLLLSNFGVEGEDLWSICSIATAIAFAGSMYSINKNMRGITRRKSLRLLFGSFQGMAALLFICLILNAVDVVFHREPGPFLTAIVWTLALVGYMFGRLLLQPLWKVVREREGVILAGATLS